MLKWLTEKRLAWACPIVITVIIIMMGLSGCSAFGLAVDGRTATNTPENIGPRVKSKLPLDDGQRVVVMAFCLTEDAAKVLSTQIATNNVEGYGRVMYGPTLCFDRTIHPFPPMYAVLGERVWTVTAPDGKTYQFWTAYDVNHKIAWIWTLKKGEGI